jgi:hypothetical protein
MNCPHLYLCYKKPEVMPDVEISLPVLSRHEIGITEQRCKVDTGVEDAILQFGILKKLCFFKNNYLCTLSSSQS